MKTGKIKVALLSVSALLFSGADAVAQGVAEAPECADSIPAAWSYTSEFSQTLPVDDAWWQLFRDPVLTRLIEQGQKNNYNLSMAVKRMEISRNTWESANSRYYPVINASAGWSATRQSAKTTAQFRETGTVDYFSLGLDMNWEIDVFGRISAQRKADRLSMDVARADYDAAQVSMAAAIARAYFNLRLYQQRLAVVNSQLESQEKLVAITKARREAGLASGLDVSQAEQVVLTTKASVPALEAMVNSALYSLATLTGRYPQQLEADLGTAAQLPDGYDVIPVGIPADLLRRRPDMVGAERQLALYAAQVGIAKKDFLPTLSLTALAGTEAHRFDNLFTAHSFGWSVAPQLTWTVFDGFARKYNVAAAKLQFEYAMDNYNMTILTAYQEVEDAMSQYVSALRALDADRLLLAQTEKSLSLSIDLYKQGLASFSDVADAQVSTLDAQNAVLSQKAGKLTALVALYQALGGGWMQQR